MPKLISPLLGINGLIKPTFLAPTLFLLLFLSGILHSILMTPTLPMPIPLVSTGYVHIDPMEVGLQYVNCSGSEGALEECAVAATTTKTQCSQAGIIRQCINGI